MNVNKLIATIAAVLITSTSYAAQPLTTGLDTQEQVVARYVLDLQKADYKDITSLFEKNGTVISTSRGKIDAKTFFYAFLPEITSATTELHQVYKSEQDGNVLAGRFHFTYKMKNGSEGSGEYIDEFTFAANSNKLENVYMFENVK